MDHRRLVRLSFTAIGSCTVLLLSACADDAASLLPPASAAIQSSTNEVMPDEAELRRLSNEVPGFAGVTVEQDGDFLILLTDRRQEARARAALVAGLPPHLRGRSGGVRVGLARFSFAELAEWRDRLVDPLGDVEGVAYLDLDERSNRIVIGVSRGSAQARPADLAERLGIPRDAVTVTPTDEEVTPLVPQPALPNIVPGGASNLDHVFRPLTAGIHIGRRSSNPDTYFQCTMGFVADLSGITVFITNSHCSSHAWQNDASIFHQPYPSRLSEEFRLGSEYKDKQGVSCGFLSWNVCRYSDATAVRIDAGISSDRGTIARTTQPGGSSPGSKTIDPSNPRFTITGKGSPFQGQILDKMGSRTGWTRGQVTRTCVVVYQSGRTFSKLRCQSFVRAGVEGGDSGSPVFFNSGNGTVVLHGIVWGKKGPECDIFNGYCDPTTEFVFSPISGIESDLGTMSVTVPSTGGGGSPSPPPPPACDPLAPTDPWSINEPC